MQYLRFARMLKAGSSKKMNESVLARYWRSYGGARALFSSGYLYSAFFLSAAMAPAWINNPWHETVLSVMPNVLGFSLGGYALLVAIGDESFRSLISGEDEDGEPSPYMEVNAAFVHFILMQLASVICALFSSAYYFKLDPNGRVAGVINDLCIPLDKLVLVGNFLGYSVFIYALLTAIAATLAILRVSSWYDLMHTDRIKKEKQRSNQVSKDASR